MAGCAWFWEDRSSTRISLRSSRTSDRSDRRYHPGPVSILCYHAVDPNWRSVLSIDPHDFERHCAWLARHRRMIALGEAVSRLTAGGRLPARTAALTFDDGFASVFDHALPALLRHGLAATVFV